MAADRGGHLIRIVAGKFVSRKMLLRTRRRWHGFFRIAVVGRHRRGRLAPIGGLARRMLRLAPVGTPIALSVVAEWIVLTKQPREFRQGISAPGLARWLRVTSVGSERVVVRHTHPAVRGVALGWSCTR